MSKVEILILGAGPAGLTFANKLKQYNITDFIVLEKELTAGGLCRSTTVDGSPFDIGGGHFLDTVRPEVTSFLFSFMPEEEWNTYDRNTGMWVNGQYIGYPIEANIWQFDIETQVEYLKSIAVAGSNLGTPLPEKFVDWIYWKLGNRIAEDYMIPYNQKMFGEDLDSLGTYWLEKLPSVSFEEVLLSCLERKAHGKNPGHTKFYYPKKYGYGELWLRIAEKIKDHVEYEKSVEYIDFNTRTVRTTDGAEYKADVIITTIPWNEYVDLIGMPDEIKTSIKKLKHSSIYTEYHEENLDTEAHWMYYPDRELSYHRILVRHNFAEGSRGYWTETNADRYEETGNTVFFKNEYAYPLNTIGKPEVMKKLLNWSEEHRVYGLGRWGEHQHFNSDVTVERAMKLAERLVVVYS